MYRLHRGGGRVKSAGLGLDLVYPEETEQYREDPSPDRAIRLRSALRDVQKNPPAPLLAAFFPMEWATIRQHLLRTGLYRSFLKTDQGPAGTFLPFVTAEGAKLEPYRINRREGVALPEANIREILASDPAAREDACRLRALYRQFRLKECAEALEGMAERVGYRWRDADVGRGLFFFCNASAADTPITVPEHVCARVEQAVNELLERTARRAAHARKLYCSGKPLPEALQTASATEPPVDVGPYFQADVYVTRDGEIEIEQIQLPDVGLFLTELPSEGYSILPQVQRVVQQLRERTTELLARSSSPIYLLTRRAVLHDREDVLEHLEIQALRKMASQAGISLCVGTPADVPRLPRGARVLLLNIDPASLRCEALLERTAHGEISCTPDPFLKLLASELTTQRRVPVGEKQLEYFLRTIRPGRQMNGGSYHVMHSGIDRIYDYAGLTADVLHVDVPGEGTPVPTVRHSMHSFTSLYNICKRHGFPKLRIREVPIHRENALLHSRTGSHISAFRFYFTRA